MTPRPTRSRRMLAAALGLGLAAALTVTATPAQAAPLGERSLAAVLTSDGNRFDRNSLDYDIVTEAVLAVLAAKPSSPVGLLTDGSVPLTAFIPNDFSFRVLVHDLTGRWYFSEQRVFEALVGAVGVDAVEQVLLYHVVPGATIDSGTALGANGASLSTALGKTFTVRVLSTRLPLVRLVDKDPDDVDPVLDPRALDLNKGNKQIAHGIWFVLRPANL